MTERPEITIQHQAAFTDDGELELCDESVETSLEVSALTSAIVTKRRASIGPPPPSSVSTIASKCVSQRPATPIRRPCSRIRLPINRRSRAKTPVHSSSSMTEHQSPRAKARARVLALAAATPNPPISGEYAHGDPCPRCEAAVLAGRFDEKREQFLECERCLYRPTGAGNSKGD